MRNLVVEGFENGLCDFGNPEQAVVAMANHTGIEAAAAELTEP